MLTFVDNQVLERAEQWQEKANNQNNSFDRFISLWIAYNMVYGLYSKKECPNESPMENEGGKAIRIKKLIRDSEPLKQYLIQITPEFAEMLNIFREEHWKKDKISLREHLLNASKKRSYEHLLDTILKLLYKIRCNLFHGQKELISESQNRLLELCSNLLEIILQESINRFRAKMEK